MRVEGDDVVVRAEKSKLAKTRRTKEAAVATGDNDNRTFLIIGGGERGRWGILCTEFLSEKTSPNNLTCIGNSWCMRIFFCCVKYGSQGPALL